MWSPYVPVATRRANAQKVLQQARKKGTIMRPVEIAGRQIANTFWGKAWCDHMESLSDFENRLPRGRSYVRNGMVIDLQIKEGAVAAQVMGSSLYRVSIQVTPLPTSKWEALKNVCRGQIDSVVELLQGKFSKAVMSRVIDPQEGLFPNPHEIKLSCSCPDWAGLCKHSAAVLYGIGAILDLQPEELFLLRQVDHLELLGASLDLGVPASAPHELGEDLGALFGIEIAGEPEQASAPAAEAQKEKKPAKRAAATPRKVSATKTETNSTSTAKTVTKGAPKASTATSELESKKKTSSKPSSKKSNS